jgi:8-oxo-dGTP pyrophosphatase MutT (NUDIX family)
MKGRKPSATAAREALEEAGLAGKISKTPIGTYQYVKRLTNGAPLDCTVEVYPMHVVRQRKRWPEQQQRAAQWFSVEDAAAAVGEPELRELIVRLGRSVSRVTLPLSALREDFVD